MQRAELAAYRIATAPVAAVPLHYVHPGLSPMQIVSILRARWKQSATILGAVLALALVVSLVMPKTYTATATLMVNYEVNDPLGGKEFPTGLLGSYMATQVELMRSPEVLRPVIERLKLTENKNYAAGFSGNPADLPEWVEKKLDKKLVIQQGLSGSQLIYVADSASDPRGAAAIANMVAQVYTEQVYERLTGPASERAKRYTQELEELKKKVAAAQDDITAFRNRTHLADIQAKADLDMALLNSLELRLQEAQNTRRAAESKLTTDQSVSNPVLSSNLVQTLKSQLATEEAKMGELRATLGPRHPQVLELQSQLAATRAALGAEVHSYASSASSDLTSARELERKLSGAVEEQRAKVLQVRGQQDEGAKFVLALQSAEDVYKKALDGYDQVMLASTGRYTNVSFVSHATPPLKPSKPNLLKNLALAFVAGGLLGLAVPFALELLRRRVRCRDDIEREHGIPVLAEFGPMPAPLAVMGNPA